MGLRRALALLACWVAACASVDAITTQYVGVPSWEAARLGADAVVVDQVQQVGAYVSGPYWAPTVQPMAGRKVVGIAVKFQ